MAVTFPDIGYYECSVTGTTRPQPDTCGFRPADKVPAVSIVSRTSERSVSAWYGLDSITGEKFCGEPHPTLVRVTTGG